MAKKVKSRGSGPGIGTNTTVTIGTAAAVVGGIVWITFYAGGIIRDVDGLKSTMSKVQDTLARIEYGIKK